MPQPETTPGSTPAERRRRRHQAAHLHPSTVHTGTTGVFAGSWSRTDDDRYPVGYIGILERRWNGWAVFACTKDVAAAIITDHTRGRDALHRHHVAAGHTDEQATTLTATAMAALRWDGDTVVHDERDLTGDPDAIHRYPPDIDGNYVICGGVWTWEAVPPRACDLIVGDIPRPPAS